MRTVFLASLFSTLLLAATPAPHAQTLWTDVTESSLQTTLGPSAITATGSRTVRLDLSQMQTSLASAPQASARVPGTDLQIPLPGGGFADVTVTEASILAPALQAKYPEIRTYLADGAGSITGRISQTPAGFRAMLFTPDGTVFVDPYRLGDARHYVVYYGRNQIVDPVLRGRIADEVIGESATPQRRSPSASRAHGDVKRTYRLAVAATGEYTAFHGGTVAQGLAAIVTTINRVTGIYERDLSVSFQLVGNNDQVVYANSATDPYTNGNAAINENQGNLDAVIGSANYDVGHVFTTSSGVASLGVVCNANSKARGTTGLTQPTGDAFDVDYVAHEMGHQFGGNHTFNGDSGACSGQNRNGSTAYEPGSGSTIQAYAGICGNDNLQSNSDAYFHGISLDEMTAHVTTGSGGTCGATTATDNTIPTVTVPGPFTIPTGTPFSLTGSATDNTPAALTYTWEEFDLGPQADVNAPQVPFFRSFSPSASPTRSFPQRDRLIAGQAPVVGEQLPSGNRTLTFRLTARDNRAGGGAINDATTTVSTVDTGAPFAVTFASTAGQSYPGTATVTWNVAGTNAGIINTPTVDILYSTDGGDTFPIVLRAATPNDGSESVVFPATTAQGRILIRGVGNVFYNVNGQPFAVTQIGMEGPPPVLAVAPRDISVSLQPGTALDRPVEVSNTAAAGSQTLVVSAAVEDLSQPGAAPSPEILAARAARDARRAAPGTPQALLAKGDASADGTGTAFRGSGGPDAFGHTWVDSNDPDGPTFAWTDISTTGTAYTLADDALSAAIPLGFAFPFYGVNQNQVRIGSNGYLTFDSAPTSGGGTFNNQDLPSTVTANHLIAPFWDDLAPNVAGTVHALAQADRFTVQYTDVRTYDDRNAAGTGNTFQVVLFADGTVLYQYLDMNASTLASATVGIENAGGTDGLTVAFNAPYVADGLAVRVAPPPATVAWASVAPAPLSIAPGASDAFTLSFDADGLPEGTYTGSLVLSSNDPDAATTTIPLTLTVGPGATVAGGAGWRLVAPAASGLTVDDLAALNLVQGVPGYYPARGANLLDYDGSAFVPFGGAGTPLSPGDGVYWYFYDQDIDPGGPSQSFALPVTLATDNAAVTTDTDVTLRFAGTDEPGANLLGNPFGTSLDVSDAEVASWTGADNLASTVVQMYSAADGGFLTSATVPTVAPWQGFVAEASAAGTLTIPETARTTGGTFTKTTAAPIVAFDLSTADGARRDRAAVVRFPEGASAGTDVFDAAKREPLADAFVALAVESGDALRAVESRPAPTAEPVVVPLHAASVGAGGDVVLTWPTLDVPDDWRAELRDRATGETLDLKTATAYAFTVTPTAARAAGPDAVPTGALMLRGDAAARFELIVGPGQFVATEGDAEAALSLASPFPNPSREQTRVPFTLATAGTVRLSVVDALGREVAVLADGERAAGSHTATLNTARLATGTYVIRLSAGGEVLTQRATVVR